MIAMVMVLSMIRAMAIIMILEMMTTFSDPDKYADNTCLCRQ